MRIESENYPEVIAKATKVYMKYMTNEERVEFLSLVKEGFCEHCGRILYVDEGDIRCHCNNDE